MEDGMILGIMTALLILSFFGGYLIADHSWAMDCARIESHISLRDKVFDCSERKP